VSNLKFFQLARIMIVSAMLLLAGRIAREVMTCSGQDMTRLNQTISSQISSNQMHIQQPQNAIKVILNDQLPFTSGGWQMPDDSQQSWSPHEKVEDE
jgi:hypothetical protein